MANNVTTIEGDGRFVGLMIIVCLLIPSFLGIVVRICYLIINKFYFKFEPIHVCMLNYFGTLSLLFFSTEIQTFLMIFPASEDLCLQYIFSLFSSMTFSFSILCMQTDRFLAIYWNVHYKERVTTSRAVKACSLSLLMCIIVSCGITIIDKSYTKCLFSPYLTLLHTRTTNISLEGIPRLLAVAETVVVSLYAIWIDKQLEKVHPGPVNLPSTSQPQRVVQARYVQRLNSDPHVFFVTDGRRLDTAVPPPQQTMYGVQVGENAVTCTTAFVIMYYCQPYNFSIFSHISNHCYPRYGLSQL